MSSIEDRWNAVKWFKLGKTTIFKPNPDLRLRIVAMKNPNHYPAYLNHRTKKLGELAHVRTSAYGKLISSGMFWRDYVQVMDVVVVAIDSKGVAVGYCTASNFYSMAGNGAHIVDLAVTKELQGKGIGKKLLQTAIKTLSDEKGYERQFIFAVTQNPIMYHVIRSVTKSVYPKINGPAPAAWVVEEAQTCPGSVIFRHRGASDMELVPGTSIIQRWYEASPYPFMPKSRDTEVNRLFTMRLHIEQGYQTRDALSIVGSL